MLIRKKISSYFEFGEFDSLELFGDYDFVEDLVSRKCFLDISVSEDDLKVYKDLRPANFEINNAIKQILGAKKDAIIENIYSNFSTVFVAFLIGKENLLSEICKKINIYIGDDFRCKKIDTNDFFKIEKEKFVSVESNTIDKYKYVFFEFNLNKISKILEKKDLKKINKFHAKNIAVNKVLDIANEKYQGEELDHFIYSGEYDWIERVDEEWII